MEPIKEPDSPAIDYRSRIDDRGERNAVKRWEWDDGSQTDAYHRYLPVLVSIFLLCLVGFCVTAFGWILGIDDNTEDWPDPEAHQNRLRLIFTIFAGGSFLCGVLGLWLKAATKTERVKFRNK